VNRNHQPAVSRVKRWRGQTAVGVRQRITQPLGRRLPVGICRRAHTVRRRLWARRYTDADAFRLIEIDPARIEQSLLETAPKRPQWGRVVSGDWDQQAEPFADRLVPRGLKQRFVEGREWRETALFAAFVDQLSRFGNAWGHVSIEGFERRCAAIERLYQSLQRTGYRRQEQLAGTARPRLAHRVDEINVDIGRNGTLYWRCYGQHRLALAKLLDLETVPVLIHRRHRDWQRHRDRLRTDGVSSRCESQSVDHPDLRLLTTSEANK